MWGLVHEPRTQPRDDAYKPCANWVISPEIGLNEGEYAYVVDAYHAGKIRIEVLAEWMQLNFAGIVPDWIRQVQAKERQSVVWDKLDELIISKPHELLYKHAAGNVCWNHDVWNSDNKMYELRPRQSVADRVWIDIQSLGCGKWSGVDWKFYTSTWPATSTMLRCRERVNIPLALQCWSKADRERRPKGAWIVNILLSSIGMGGQFVANWIMCGLCNPIYWKIADGLIRNGIFSRGLEYYIKVTKEIHATVRATACAWCPLINTVCEDDYNLVMYLNLLAGRYAFTELNTLDELVVRSEEGRPQVSLDPVTGHWTTEQFERDVANARETDIAGFLSGFMSRRNWQPEDILANVTMFGTRGAASVMRKVKLEYGDKKVSLHQPSKTVWLNQLSVSKLIRVLERKPQLRGTGIDKYEPGRLRMLLPGPIYHWLIESLILTSGEESVYKKDDKYSLAKSDYDELFELTCRMADAASDYCKVDSDYADFNILHTFERMQAHWCRLAEALNPNVIEQSTQWRGMDYRSWAAYACRWVAAALYDVQARSNSKDVEWVTLVRGLWSGWRSTTFINTTHNKYYQYAVEMTHRRMYKCWAIRRSNVLGDDMSGTAAAEYRALRFLQLTDAMGLDAQAIKQLLSPFRTEYLRVMHTKNELRGSLVRSIANATSSDAQGQPCDNGPEAARGVNDVIHVFCRRGADIELVESWRYVLVQAWAHVRVRRHNKQVTIECPRGLLTSSQSSGGIGCHRYLGHGTIPEGKFKSCASTFNQFGVILSQLPNYGSQYAYRKFMQRLKDCSVGLQPGANLVQGHAGAILKGSLPIELRMKAKTLELNCIAEWYDRNRTVRVKEVPVDASVNQIVRAQIAKDVDCILQCKRLCEIPHLDNVLAAIIQGCLGEMSSVPEVLTRLEGYGDMLDIASRLGGRGLRDTIRAGQWLIGREKLAVMVREGLKCNVPSYGALPGVMMILARRALSFALLADSELPNIPITRMIDVGEQVGIAIKDLLHDVLGCTLLFQF